MRRSLIARLLPAIAACLVSLIVGAGARADDAPSSGPPTQTLHILPRADGEITAVCFSPDGRKLAMGTGGLLKTGEVFLVDVESFKKLPNAMEGTSMTINAMAFSPDGKMLAATTGLFGKVDDKFKVIGVTRVWDAASGKPLMELSTRAGMHFSLAFAPDGGTLLTGDDDGAVTLWDVAAKKEIRAIRTPAGRILSVCFSADGKQIIAAGRDGVIRILDAATGEKIANLEGHEEGVRGLVLLKDGKTLLSAGYDGRLIVWSLPDRKQTRAFPIAGKSLSIGIGKDGKPTPISRADVRELSVSADEKLIAVGLFRNIKIFELATGREVAELTGHTGQLNCARFSPDGRFIASGDNFDGRLWGPAKKSEATRSFSNGKPIRKSLLSRDGRRVVIAADTEIKVRDRTAEKTLWSTQAHDRSIDALALSADGRLLATSTLLEKRPLVKNSEIKLWEVETGRLIWTVQGHEDRLRSLAISPDGKTVASGGEDREIRLWDARNGDLLDTLKGHEAGPALLFSPDGRKLYSACLLDRRYEPVGGEFMVWNVDNGRKLVQIKDTALTFGALSFTADGKTIVSHSIVLGAKKQFVLLLLDPETGKEKDRIVLPEDAKASSLSPDGRLLALGIQNRISIRDARSGRELAAFSGHNHEIRDLHFAADGSFLLSGGWSDPMLHEWDLKRFAKSQP